MEPTTAAAAGAAHTQLTGNFITDAFAMGGPAMYIIAIVGFMTVALVIERWIKLRSLSVDKEDINGHLFGVLTQGNITGAITYCSSHPAPLTSVLKAGLEKVWQGRPDEEVQVAMDAAVLRETPKIEGWAAFLGVFANVGTLVGLTGTIAGMIKSFRGVAAADGAEKATRLSEGISEALHCTAFGLIVAIVGILAYGYFQVRIGRMITEMQESSMNIMNLVVSNRDKMKG